ncbi:MAG: translation initiation factor IF-6 [Thermoplasmatales archaeon]|nr:translation initiation factor IF-6 [Thermoplasmatales archaeon]
MRLADYDGNPNIGVYAAVAEELAFLPPNAPAYFEKALAETLGVEVVRTTVAGSLVVGSLMAINSHGAVVSELCEQNEAELISSKLPLAYVDDRMNAAGNNILVNDNGAIVNPEISKSALRGISKALGVDCVRGTVAGMGVVGSACLATNKGAAIHPEATDEEISLVEETLGVKAYRTTLNHGVRLLAACSVANSKGAVIGRQTTPIEMGRLEEALALY